MSAKKKAMARSHKHRGGVEENDAGGGRLGSSLSLAGNYLKTSDFIMDKYAIGKGSFGFVILAKSKINNMTYALKQTRKVDVVKKKAIKF